MHSWTSRGHIIPARPLPHQVLFAGEFCILPSLTQPVGSYRFIVDNNSGTFAPPPSGLSAMGALLRFNFPGLEVEVGLLPLVWNHKFA